jgi:hypothetical protein
MADIFLSFIHEEEEVASEVKSFISKVFDCQIAPFMSSDQESIYAGEDWMARIFGELTQAKILISMLSPVSMRRPWINFEAGAAWAKDIIVIPVCFGGLTVSSLEKPYSSRQAVAIEDYDGSYYLVSSIAHHLKIDLPEKPIFSNTVISLSGFTQEEKEKNDNCRAPYKYLNSWLKLNREG